MYKLNGKTHAKRRCKEPSFLNFLILLIYREDSKLFCNVIVDFRKSSILSSTIFLLHINFLLKLTSNLIYCIATDLHSSYSSSKWGPKMYNKIQVYYDGLKHPNIINVQPYKKSK